MVGMFKTKWSRLLAIVFGAFLYAVGMNFFIVPYGLCSGGGVGVAQLLTLLLEHFIKLPAGINMYGVVYLLINIPIVILALKGIGKTFFVKTVIGSGSISLFMSLLPLRPLMDDILSAVLIGGIVSGIGVGVLLVAGGCGGGIDVVGVWAAKKYKGASVGKISLVFNAMIYAIMLVIFDIQTVIYSLVYMVFFTLMLDKVHYQNINVRLMIFTKKEGIDKQINEQTGRGVTEWKGIGAYTGDETRILISCINKYEVNEFMDIIKSIDPQAFIIMDEGVYVAGNFEKRI